MIKALTALIPQLRTRATINANQANQANQEHLAQIEELRIAIVELNLDPGNSALQQDFLSKVKQLLPMLQEIDVRLSDAVKQEVDKRLPAQPVLLAVAEIPTPKAVRAIPPVVEKITFENQDKKADFLIALQSMGIDIDAYPAPIKISYKQLESLITNLKAEAKSELAPVITQLEFLKYNIDVQRAQAVVAAAKNYVNDGSGPTTLVARSATLSAQRAAQPKPEQQPPNPPDPSSP
jgi:hypothetical protein